ncbi:tetratricopeptide repeat protein [Bacteroidetes/Chlorobi group bacterium ChocPot_Mid]|nr:MAG: tetratricopeptide repeat protein [Bacteroidetes/Chlorobi group bacterium ChocPot_Mid]
MSKNKKNIKNNFEQKKELKVTQLNSSENKFILKIEKTYFIIILGFIVAVYLQVINFTFTGFDDDFLIVNNMQNLMNARFIDVFAGNSFLSDAVSGFYRPIQTITFITDAQIGSGALWIFHLTNLILFYLSSLLVYRLLRIFDFSSVISLIATLILTVHPLFNLNVAWLPSRGDLLLAAFGLASFIQFITYLEKKKTINLIFHFVLLLFAFLSKETAIVLPLLMFSYSLIFRKKIFTKEILTSIPFWVVAYLVWGYLRFTYSGSLPQNQIFGIIPFLENLKTIPEYISKFILPINLMSLPVFSWVTTIIGIVFIAIFIFLYIKNKNEIKNNLYSKILLFEIFWFVLFVLPGMLYSRFYPKSEMFYHYLDHRAYLPMIGFIIALLILINPIIQKIDTKKIFKFGIIITVILSLYSFLHVKTFASPDTFLSDAIKDNPKASVVYFLRGNFWKDSGDLEKALNDYSRSISIDKNYAEAYNNRGSIYGLLGEYQKSIEDLNKAIKLEPNIPDGYFNRAIAKDALGDFKGAIIDFTESLKITPNDYLNYYLRANCFSKFGDLQKSLEDYNKSISLNPRFADAYNNRGIVLYKLNEKNAACSDWQTATKLGSSQAKQMLEKYCSNP